MYPVRGQNSGYVRGENTVKSEPTHIKNTTKKWQIALDITTKTWYSKDNPKGHSKKPRHGGSDRTRAAQTITTTTGGLIIIPGPHTKNKEEIKDGKIRRSGAGNRQKVRG